MTSKQFSFTGEGLAKAHLLDLTREEKDEYFKKNKTRSRVHSCGFFPALLRRIRLDTRKIFLIRFKDSHGVIIMADNARDACVEAVPFLVDHLHSCGEPRYNKTCEKCVAMFDELAERINNATVTWLGWGQPDYNWVLHI